jgi:hypothetical protein
MRNFRKLSSNIGSTVEGNVHHVRLATITPHPVCRRDHNSRRVEEHCMQTALDGAIADAVEDVVNRNQAETRGGSAARRAMELSPRPVQTPSERRYELSKRLLLGRIGATLKQGARRLCRRLLVVRVSNCLGSQRVDLHGASPFANAAVSQQG